MSRSLGDREKVLRYLGGSCIEGNLAQSDGFELRPHKREKYLSINYLGCFNEPILEKSIRMVYDTTVQIPDENVSGMNYRPAGRFGLMIVGEIRESLYAIDPDGAFDVVSDEKHNKRNFSHGSIRGLYYYQLYDPLRYDLMKQALAKCVGDKLYIPETGLLAA